MMPHVNTLIIQTPSATSAQSSIHGCLAVEHMIKYQDKDLQPQLDNTKAQERFSKEST